MARKTLLSGILCAAVIALPAFVDAQITVVQESFETDGLGTRYVASEVCNDGFGDFFTRTDGTDITGYAVTGQDGTFWYAAQDTDGAPCTLTTETLTFNTWTLSNCDPDLQLSAFFAEDDSGDGNEDWDDSSQVILEYSADGGAFVPLICFATPAGGSTTNEEPLYDADCDGDGTGGIPLTTAFAEFTGDIPGIPTTLQLQVRIVMLDAGDEDISFDNIRLLTGINDIDCDAAGVPVELMNFGIE